RNQSRQIRFFGELNTVLERIKRVSIVVRVDVGVADFEIGAREPFLIVDLVEDAARLFVKIESERKFAGVTICDRLLVENSRNAGGVIGVAIVPKSLSEGHQ